MLKRYNTDPIAPTHEEIALRAYYLWQQEGQPQGRDQQNWQDAEQQLREMHKQEQHALRGWEKSRGLHHKKWG